MSKTSLKLVGGPGPPLWKIWVNWRLKWLDAGWHHSAAENPQRSADILAGWCCGSWPRWWWPRLRWPMKIFLKSLNIVDFKSPSLDTNKSKDYLKYDSMPAIYSKQYTFSHLCDMMWYVICIQFGLLKKATIFIDDLHKTNTSIFSGIRGLPRQTPRYPVNGFLDGLHLRTSRRWSREDWRDPFLGDPIMGVSKTGWFPRENPIAR